MLKLALALALLLPLQRLLHRHLQGLLYLLTQRRSLSLTLYAILLLPGIALHEGGHWLAAKLLRVPTRGFSLLPRRRRGGTLQLGYVETAEVDPLRASLIGLAPLIVGGALLAWLAVDHLGLGLLSRPIAEGDIRAVGRALGSIVSRPDLALWLYLIFAISNTMLPSRSDRAPWLAALAILGALALAGVTLGIADPLADWLGPLTFSIAAELAGVFLLTAVLDLLLLFPILLLEILLARLVGWEIVY